MAKTNLFTASLLPLLLIACAGSPESTEADPTAKPPARPSTEGPKAPPVQGKPQASDLVESLGVFVTNAGSTTPDGTRARPFASIQQAIDAGKKAGKRVYVCAGSYSEALVVADSISVIGGLDCSKPEWTIGAPNARSKVVSPTSPAIIARSIVTATKLSGLGVVAPNATEAGASSIALLAEKSPALSISSSELAAGDGSKGADGADPTLLLQSGSVEGTVALDWAVCEPGTCSQKVDGSGWVKLGPNPGGTSVCGGAADQNGEAGGAGGSGGLWRWEMGAFQKRWVVYDAVSNADSGEVRTSAVGIGGDNGVNGTLGSLGPDGYVTADGTAGTDGKPGKGGSGGGGSAPRDSDPPIGTVARGASGAGGGAGGCPGLAGTQGQGGGASIAVALVESPIEIEDCRMTSRAGGASGLGSFGVRPSRGGAAAPGFTLSGNGGPGGNGGLAGTSGNGGAGPSFGVAHSGGAPVMKGSSSASAGAGGQGASARTRVMGVGGDVTIAATPNGLSEPIHAF